MISGGKYYAVVDIVELFTYQQVSLHDNFISYKLRGAESLLRRWLYA